MKTIPIKSRSPFYAALLMFMLLACSHLSAASLDFKVPPKPKQGIADEAQLFDPVQLSDLETKCHQQLLKRVLIKPYVLTIKDTLWSNIDTIITMVCTAWDMYDVDSFSLLIMTDAKAPRFRTVSSKLGRLTLSDTLANYLCKKRLPAICLAKGAAAAADFFVNSIRLDMFTHGSNFGSDYTQSKFYDEFESLDAVSQRLSAQEEYDQYKASYGKPEPAPGMKLSGWLVGLYCFFCMAVMIIYIISWSIYRSNGS